jgi:Tfp pilus assembly protein FimT
MKKRSDSAGILGQKRTESPTSARFRQNAGFSMTDIMIGLMVATILAGFALVNLNGIIPGMRTNEAMYQAMAQLRRGRESAIAQRRGIELRFPATNQMQLARVEEPVHNTTILSTVTLNHDCEFLTLGGIPDTPDLFGATAASIAFGGTGRIRFLSDGTLVDDAGNPVNGTVFLGMPNHPEVTRAVTVLGATGRIRGYRWTGEKWIQ